MEMNSIKEALLNCPRCGRHCPIDAVSCNRGKELVEKLMNSEMTLEAAAQPSEGKSREVILMKAIITADIITMNNRSF